MSICITCGTNQEDPQTGYCINDHDDWLEERDFKVNDKASRRALQRACAAFRLEPGHLYHVIKERASLSQVLYTEERTYVLNT